MTRPVQQTIKYTMMPNNVRLSLKINCEEVYRVFYGDFEVVNTLDRIEAEYLFDLNKNGYNFYKPFGKEKIK